MRSRGHCTSRSDDAALLEQGYLELLQCLGANGWLAELGWLTVSGSAELFETGL